MKNFIETHLLTAFILTLVALALVFGAYVAHYNQSAVETKISARIAEEEEVMHTLATLTDHNGADATTERLVQDCSRRAEYESLLMSLETLPKKGLLEAQNLFESCGTFYAERKALMVATLERELLAYLDFVELYAELREDVSVQQNTISWQKLVQLEGTRSSLLTEQASIQSKIITLLIGGSTAYSADVVALVRDASEIGELLGVTDYTIDELRTSLK